MRGRPAFFSLALAVLLAAGARVECQKSPDQRFREASDLVRAGDFIKGAQAYREIASGGTESASLYWNWAQAASARGELGEALWAALRARDLDPGDGATGGEIRRLREALSLDPAEIAPDPLLVIARTSRRFALGLLALALAALSVVLRLLARLLPTVSSLGSLSWGTLAAAALIGALPIAGSFAQETAVVVRKGAPLFDSASEMASPMGTLRLGEVVALVERSQGYLRVEDSSGARGWARQDDVWPLERPPQGKEQP